MTHHEQDQSHSDDNAEKATGQTKGPASGEVSEVSGMRGEPEPISPSDATAGEPEGESGDAQEGQAGPDAVPAENVERNHLRD